MRFALGRSSFPSVALLLAACGGGGGGGSTPEPAAPPPAPPPPLVTTVELVSESGDPVGEGQNFTYTKANSQIRFFPDGVTLVTSVRGDEDWNGRFTLPDTVSRLERGTYSNLPREPESATEGGLSWTRPGLVCNESVGAITIESVSYDGDELVQLEMSFEQYCNGSSVPLRGDIVFDIDDPTVPPGPAQDIPESLWSPAEGETPATGSYVYFESSAGDPVGQGATYLYTNADAGITVNGGSAPLSVTVQGNQVWFGDFVPMSSISRLGVGYYPDLKGTADYNPAKGAIRWTTNAVGCGTVSGWFAIDEIRFVAGALEFISIRFEQSCDGQAPLNGEIVWDINNAGTAAGPELPVPADLWAPVPGQTPETGSYVYLQSEPGDFIGQGLTYLHTRADSTFLVNTSEAYFSIRVLGADNWDGEFQGMASLARLEPGYYGDLVEEGTNPVRGGLIWMGNGRICNALNGWFVVDEIRYDGDTLLSIKMRFEQHCDGSDSALNGEIYWDSGDNIS